MPPSSMLSTNAIAASSSDAASSAHRFTHLPTPQSPNNWGAYMFGLSSHPTSPVAVGSPSCRSPVAASADSIHGTEDPPPRNNHIVTPQFSTPNSVANLASPQPSVSRMSNGLESPISISSSKRMATPNSVLDTTGHRQASSQSPQTPQGPPHTLHALALPIADDIFSAPGAVASSNHGDRPAAEFTASRLSSPPTPPPINADVVAGSSSGGELNRIRQAEMEQQLAQYQEAESRRPEYLVRTKRTLAEADPAAFDEGNSSRDRSLGIMDSPSKGRRIKLFQETSEESFEESLMAGGYGRYRTADWVRAPQPMPPLSQRVTPTPAAAPIGGATLEDVEPSPPPPPTEKELTKRKRLSAFRGESIVGNNNPTKLIPVELEGKGRVLLDVVPSELPIADAAGKKKTTGRRRKKPEDRRTLAATVMTSDRDGFGGDRPNWPDAEFPWKLRTDEREEHSRQEEEEKLKWIERFLDRESDDEDDAAMGTAFGEDEEILPSAAWGQVYEDDADRPMPPRRGRGKMVPCMPTPRRRSRAPWCAASSPATPATPAPPSSRRRACARCPSGAPRTLTDRQNEMICVCKGRDDGKDLVQCDACRMWYHLRCIGIRNMSDLGKEEDPWFCERCVDDRSVSSDDEHEPMIFSEPTFVPTEDLPALQRSQDTSFYPHHRPPTGSPASPARRPRGTKAPPTSPTRAGPDPARRRLRVNPARRPGFDPMSTPSRGIRVPAHFTTPKANTVLWAHRPGAGISHTPGVSHTPSRQRGLQNRVLGAFPPADHSENLYTPSPRPRAPEESPVRRSVKDSLRVYDSPAMRSLSMLAQASVEESPIVRSKGKERPGRSRLDHD
ncbi:hypothetical protein BD626DRAFT_497162 [Schizophyllum amplum]|uniref:PHD-type domain-containing protein n=1 Tax=Schizophyllum amplum TaxID=97359 RepID=A0A550CDU6_9AGAR|nr:hypothetical protein BD626DRAFT_497162 [Auriculariopsis ampla]